MVRTGILALIGALAIAGAAEAGSTKVAAIAGSSVSTSPITNYGPGSGEVYGGAYDSYVNVGSNYVDFKSANATSGPYTFTSASIVNLTITNTTNSFVKPTLHSQVTPAGMGFYMADTSQCTAGFGICAQDMSASFADLNLTSETPVTLASFDFRITDGDATLYRASGAIGLTLNSYGEVTTWQTFNRAATRLTGFGVEQGDASSFVYNWDATDIYLNLPGMEQGASQTLRYTTTVSSYSDDLCIDDTTTCLVAFAGFGDPIGRGGGVDSLAAIRPSMFFSPPQGIQGLSFDQFTMYTNNYDPQTGKLDTTAPGAGAVPEPATWAMMILGFGLIGSAVRRRKGLVAA